MHCAQPDEPPFLIAATGVQQRDCSDATAHAINEEVKSLLQELYAEAKQILTEHRDELDRVTERFSSRRPSTRGPSSASSAAPRRSRNRRTSAAQPTREERALVSAPMSWAPQASHRVDLVPHGLDLFAR